MGGPSLEVDRPRFEAVERLALYEIINTVLSSQLQRQRALYLRAEEDQVFIMIATATVQRYARAHQPVSDYLGAVPLPAGLAGCVSRRRIAEVLRILLETVRRHVARLLERGLVVGRAGPDLDARWVARPIS